MLSSSFLDQLLFHHIPQLLVRHFISLSAKFIVKVGECLNCLMIVTILVLEYTNPVPSSARNSEFAFDPQLEPAVKFQFDASI